MAGKPGRRRGAVKSNLSLVPSGTDLAWAELRLQGKTYADIGQMYGKAESTIAKAVNKPNVRQWIADRQEDSAAAVQNRILATADELVSAMTDLAMNADNETPHAVRLAALDKLLTRAIGAPTQRSEISGPGGAPVQIQAVEAMIAERLRTVSDADLGLPDDGES